jgi:hypothetical protein
MTPRCGDEESSIFRCLAAFGLMHADAPVLTSLSVADIEDGRVKSERLPNQTEGCGTLRDFASSSDTRRIRTASRRIGENRPHDTRRMVLSGRRPHTDVVAFEARLDQGTRMWTDHAPVRARVEVRPLRRNEASAVDQRLIQIEDDEEPFSIDGLGLLVDGTVERRE